MKIQTEICSASADATLLSTVEQKVIKLKNFFSRINEARISLRMEENETKKNRIAEIRLHIPNGVIFIKESSQTFEAALDKAIVALKCQLVRCKAKESKYHFT